jgi:DNA-binding MarR family transcriptional regulator
MTDRTEQNLLFGTALAVFKLNGQLLGLAESMARPVGLTAAWWQVLGAVLPRPLSVSGIAREMGITRQSVQRIADLLVDRGLAAYEDNPAHLRAKLLTPTTAGREAVSRIGPAHALTAHALTQALGQDAFAQILAGLQQLSAAVEVVRTTLAQAQPEAMDPVR